jgi:hypothetical protein
MVWVPLLLSICCTSVIRCLYSRYLFCALLLKKVVFSLKKQVFISEFYILISVFMATDRMKKTWLILPGYCVGLGCLLLITYRTLLAVSSPGKAIMVSVNRFGEQYLDVVALVFLWVVCLVGLLCLSRLGKEMNRRKGLLVEPPRKGVLVSPIFSFDVLDSVHQRSTLAMIEDTGEVFFTSDAASVSADDATSSVSVSLVVQQEGF